jgi:hypothetical protein
MLKKCFILTLAIVLAFSCVACAKEPEPTEPVETLPTNVFSNQSEELDYLIMDGQAYLLDATLPTALKANSYIEGTDDTALSLALGYPKGDAKYLFYQIDNESTNCVYCCLVENNLTVTISYRVIEPTKLNVDAPLYTTANSKTFYANYLSPDKTVDDVLQFMGVPDDTEMNESNFISKMTYKHKNAEGKINNKVIIEFVGERVYKITIEKRLAA